MAVQDTHEEYKGYIDEWKACRDAIAGQREIHEAGVKYLPMLSEQTKDEYSAYKKRALFYEATGRTVDGLTGMIFRKPMKIETAGMADFIQDVTSSGVSLEDFTKKITKDVISVGRCGVLVDYTAVDVSAMTAEQAKQQGARPFLKHYQAEAIINWRISNRIEEVRLKECVEVKGAAEFEYKEIDQIRVLDFDETGNYRQRIFREQLDEKGVKKWLEVQVIYPMVNGAFLKYIPFVFFSVDGEQTEIEEPLLMGLVNVNISHYRNTADYEHGAHYTGLPTAIIAGFVPDPTKETTFAIGASGAWMFPDPNTNVHYLEFTGQGLQTLKDLLTEKEAKMASLGAQMLTPETRRNEAAETSSIRHMGENSILSALSKSISNCINKALTYAGVWLNSAPATIELNQDFLPTTMTPQMLQQLVASWQAGAISAETLFENLKAGEIIDSEKTFEQETAEIQTNPIMV